MKSPLHITLRLAALGLLGVLSIQTTLAQRPLGVDVSSFQPGINWTSVHNAGYSFAWAKATEATYTKDSTFTYNESNGKAAGMLIGAYHFARPDLNSPGSEANYFWGTAASYVKGDGLTLMPMLDMETFQGLVGASSYANWADAWCSDIQGDAAAQGVTIKPVIYTTTCEAGNLNSSVAQWLPWIANPSGENAQTGSPWHNTSCTGDDWWGGWTVWQYDWNGSVSGIAQAVDRDVFNGTASTLQTTLVATEFKIITKGDYNGDGKTDVAVFRPSNGDWYINENGATVTINFGAAGDIPTPGDYDGDGKTDVAVFRPSNGYWYVLNSSNGQMTTSHFGMAGDIPVQGNYTGTGKSSLAVFRPSNGHWYIFENGGTTEIAFGVSGDIPVPGDYDGDGKTDVAVFRPSNSTWYILRSTDGGTTIATFGAHGDIPVPGDYNGDGKTDLAVFRPSNCDWYLDENGTTTVINFGTATDVLVPSDYDGDGKTDVGVFRPSNGNWYFIQSSNGQTITETFGVYGDIPLL